MKTRVAVVYGGRSGEHEISLRSAESVVAAIDPRRYEVVHYRIGPDGKWDPKPILPEPESNSGIDVIFPVLHGTFGEDGAMQGLFELADLPYVGANVLASAVSMDKDIMKRVCRDRNLPVVEYETVTRDEIESGEVNCEVPFPIFVKPANLGSSVGISKAHNCHELKEALRVAAQYDRKVIVERGIEGREFECAVLGNEDPAASIPCEILPSREFYDYEDKYLLNKARTDLPANLAAEEIAEMRRLAVECYKAVGCEGMGRVDFLREAATGKLYINEINTIPGFTSISMYPKMWEYTGIPYSELIDRLIELALERHNQKESHQVRAMTEKATWHALAAAFYARVGRDPVLRPLFPGKSLHCAIEEFSAFLVQLDGGPPEDSQRRWWASLRESHARFQIAQPHRARWLELMRQTMDALPLESGTAAFLRDFFERSSAYVAGIDPNPPVEIAAVEEAVAAVRRGEIPRSIHPGVFPLMIRGNHAQTDYVITRFTADPTLIHDRFAGRSLLQDAAACGNLKVVEILLRLGAGTDEALYSTANECRTAAGAAIVEALVRAGADVNAVHGVKRCTPLHMAARRGNIEIARALLEHGADPEPRDSKGVTPYERALNCRKPAVAAEIMKVPGVRR